MAYIEPKKESHARIKVVGVGGGGQNAVSSMVDGGKIKGVEFIAMNTDLQALEAASTQVRIQLGPDRTHGLGSGSDPDVGREAAEESIEDIRANLQGADMVFIAAGEGGGTGTGASPVVAQVAREAGALTVGVVNTPFQFEGARRMNQAQEGIKELRGKVDALIIIPNEKLLSVVDENMPFREAFKVADNVIGKAVEGISELITSTGLVNVDFADVKTVMTNAGSALMGVGEADGENRAEKSAKASINSPLLDVDIKGSTGVLINIAGDASMSMHEVNKAAKIIADAAHEGANIIFGANVDPSVQGMRVTVIATGFDSSYGNVPLIGTAGISDDDLIEQIDSRFDQLEETEKERNEEPHEDFDINKLRQEVKEMDEDDKDKKKKDRKDKEDIKENDQETASPEEEPQSRGSFWKLFDR